MRRRRRWRRGGAAVQFLIGLLVAATLVYALGFGVAGLPAPGPVLDPGQGVWTAASTTGSVVPKA